MDLKDGFLYRFEEKLKEPCHPVKHPSGRRKRRQVVKVSLENRSSKQLQSEIGKSYVPYAI